MRLLHFLSIVFSFALFSCGDVKQISYFQGEVDTLKTETVNYPQPVIQKGDLISIVVFSDNPAATAIYNQSSANVTAGDQSLGASQSGGYLVDHSGSITFQGLGQLKVEGLTKSELVDLLNSRLKDTLLTNPYYNIRFVNFKVTVVGDVTRPGVYTIPNERVNVIEAIGLAGDLTMYGKRDNITVIRERNGVRYYGKLDLTSTAALNSPYYNLQQNDVVIVNAVNKKAAAADQVTGRNIQIATSILSVIAIIISVLTR